MGAERRAKKGWRNVGICEGNARRKSWEIVNASLFRRTMNQKKKLIRSIPNKSIRLTLTALPAFTRSSNVLDLDKLDDGLVHTLYGICTHHFWSAVQAVYQHSIFGALKMPTRSCDNDHGMCMGYCGSHSRERERRGKEKKAKSTHF